MYKRLVMELNQYAERKSITKKDPVYSGYSVWRAIVEKKQKNTKTFLDQIIISLHIQFLIEKLVLLQS